MLLNYYERLSSYEVLPLPVGPMMAFIPGPMMPLSSNEVIKIHDKKDYIKSAFNDVAQHWRPNICLLGYICILYQQQVRPE